MTAVLIPWRSGCPHREAALDWTLAHIEAWSPDVEVILGSSPDGLFSRSAAILDAFSRSTADTLLVLDGDVWCDPTEAIDEAQQHGWAVPHRLIHRLSADSTAKVLAGADWHGLPLSTDNRQDHRPYKGHATGTCVVMRRDVLESVPPDPRFVGWGHEDDAWAIALRCLVGAPWRGTADLVHLWHPAQPRLNRRVGSHEGAELARRYQAARKNPDAMRALITETRVMA